MNNSSILNRYFVSFGSNGLRAFFSFITGLLIARGLGTYDYGVFSFLLASFGALLSLLDMGTSNAFFTFISKRTRSKFFFLAFFGWVLLIFSISLMFIGLIAPDNWIEFLWAGEDRDIVTLAFLVVFLKTYVWNIISQIAESQRYTKKSQLLSLFIAFVHLCLIILIIDRLTIQIIFGLVILEFFLAMFIAYWILPISFSGEKEKPSDILNKYWIYCLPIIPYVWLGMVVQFADTWLLQRFGGATEQAYYRIALAFSVVCILATSSLLKILWKEVAEANERKNFAKVKYLYMRSTRILFILATIMCCLFVPLTGDIIKVSLGEEYLPGSLVMSLMFLYPIQQTIGQINGSMYFSLEMTKEQSLIGMVFMVLSSITVYFLLAPKEAYIPGLGLASFGLAVKMLAIQFFFVIFSSWYLCKQRGWEFKIAYQFFYPVLFLILSYGCYFFAEYLFSELLEGLFFIVCSALIYLIISVALVIFFPVILGLTKTNLKDYFMQLTSKV